MNLKDSILQFEYAKVKQGYIAAKKYSKLLPNPLLVEDNKCKPLYTSNVGETNDDVGLKKVTTHSKPPHHLSTDLDNTDTIKLEKLFLQTAGLRAGRENSLVRLFNDVSTAHSKDVSSLMSRHNDWKHYADLIETNSNHALSSIKGKLKVVLNAKESADRDTDRKT